MNKKQNLLAIALSASFVLAGANVAEANDQVSTQVEDVVLKETDAAISNQETSQTNKNNNEPSSSEETVAQSDEENTNANAEADKELANAKASKSLPTDKVVEPEGPVGENLQVGPETKPVSQGAEAPQPDSNQGKEAQKAREQEADDPNYGEDEGKIKDYNESERYKQTDLQPGDTNQESGKTDEKKVKDGLKFELKNPSGTSPSKTEYGYQITIDKKTGQRTYTKVYVTDSGLIPVDPGEKPMMNVGEKLTPESPDTTYKPDENVGLTASRQQRNLNYEASEETLKHINNKDNPSTSFGMKDNYTTENPGVKFFGKSFALGYKVNPWPNENDKLEELKLNTNNYDPKKKFFVQGQDIDTGIKVDNIDESAKERLVGQVYNPITGKIVPGASAYIGDNGNIHIKMPDGALKKDDNGKTVINDGSIFNTPDYKALQNLDVKFFARPRTAEEFKRIAETPDDYGETGTYTGSGAGTAEINHKGTNVKIDKQGIDRYDHYNLIGGFKLNLDDTRYYNQSFEDGNGDDTSKVTSSAVKPGEEFKVGMVKPENPRDTDKSAEDMNAADERGEASGKLIMDFIEKENKGKAEEDQWKVKVDPHDISKFTITPPKSAKAGDFIAIPIEYTYTNGSKDVHWFHFVVQESTYIKPEYDAQVNFPVNEQTSEAKVTEDGKRLTPDHYTLPDTLETDEAGNKLATDDKGNKWTVKVDEKTGKVSAKPVDPTAFDGGEKLTVPVVAHYVDKQKPGKDITEEVNAYFVIEEKANMTPRYNAKAGKVGDKLVSDVILNTEDKYNRKPGKYTLDSPTYTDDKGNTWNVSINEETGVVTATVPNAAEGKKIDGALLNVPVTAHYYEEDAEGKKVEAGTKKTEVQFVASGTKGEHTYKEELSFGVEVRKDPNLKKGEWKYATDDEGNELKGEKGEQEVTLTIENSEVTGKSEPKVTKQPKNAVVLVGEGTNDGTHEITEKKNIDYKTIIEYDESLDAGQVVETGGTPGKQERTNTLVIKDGKVTETNEGEFKTTKKPVDKVIKIGIKPIVKKVEKPFKTDYIYDENVEMGKEEEVTPGEKGKVTITTSYDKEQKKLVTKEETKDPVKRVVKVGIKPVVKEEEIPAGKKYKHNPELEDGVIRKVKNGTPGKVIITTTFNKETGKIETKVERTEPTDAVYEYGSKTEGKVKVESELPYEVEIIKDPEMEAGKTETVQEGKLGKKETTITIENSKEVSREEKVTEKPVKKIVKVGTKCKCEKPDNPPSPGEDPKKPEKPGEDKPNKPGKPNEPGTPGETPNKPGKPNEPGTPGERPNQPGKPGEPGKENPKTPESPKENPKKDENIREEKNNSDHDMLSRKRKDSDELSRKDKSTNPKTGVGSIAPILSSMGISIAGLLATKKKKKEDE